MLVERVGKAGTASMITASTDSAPLIEDITGLCISATERSAGFQGAVSQVQSEFAKMSPKPTPESYQSVAAMVNTDMMKSIIKDMKVMQKESLSCVTQSKKLTKTLEAGARDIPDFIKNVDEEVSEESSQGTEEVSEDHDINDIESDIAEINNSAKSLESMDWFTANPKGSLAFESLATRGDIITTLFNRMKILVESIGEISQSFLIQGCGSKVKASVSGAKDMLHCLHLSKSLEKFAKLALSAIQAIAKFIKAAWTRIKAFVKEYQAARKIQSFTNGIAKKDEDWDILTTISGWVPSDPVAQPAASCFG
jgi:hypothetical protein